jgi:hypothetical protein
MTRIRTITALTAVAALALPGAALAAKVTGGTTQFTLSSGTSNAARNNHLTITQIGPATASGSTFTFPIARGFLSRKDLHGRIGQRGGFKISNGSRAISVRHLELVINKHGDALDALYARKLHGHGKPTRIVMVFHKVARITDVSVKNGTATGTVKLTNYSAGRLDRLAGKPVAKGGTPIGTITVTPTFG